MSDKLANPPTNIEELAIMINNSFEALHKYLDKRFGPIEGDVSVLKTDVSTLKQDVGHLKTDVSVLKQDVGELKQNVRSLNRRTESLVTDVGHIKKVVKRLPTQKNLTNLKKRVYVLEHAS